MTSNPPLDALRRAGVAKAAAGETIVEQPAPHVLLGRMLLPNGCTRDRAVSALAMYDVRREGGYKNQVITERQRVRMITGMTVRDLRVWLAANSNPEVPS